MKRTLISPEWERFPAEIRPLLEGAALYDSSCSPQARVLFIDKEDGFFLKSAPKGALKTEGTMTRYFHSLGLGAEVLHYHSDDQDWLLTRRVPGEDCLDSRYLSDPKRLCDTTAELLRQLHETDTSHCPVNRTQTYIAATHRNFSAGRWDKTPFPADSWGYSSAEEAWNVVLENEKYLCSDTLLHGDYCLPNIMLDNWKRSGFIDVGCGGIGDRHIDLFWGIWSLSYNLKTNAYHDRFLDAYGRDKIQPEKLRVIAAFEVFGE